MAVRIPVVVSQCERRSGSMADYEEQLITKLIFENGLDATLVADLKSIAIDTTDHLCIEGLKGDFAIATWESMAYVCEHLHRLGVDSLELLPVDGSPKMVSRRDGAGPSSHPKTIFFVSLSTSTPIDKTIHTLRTLRESRSIPVFSLGGIRPKEVQKSIVPFADESIRTEMAAAPAKTIQESTSHSELTKQNTEESEDDLFPDIDQLMLDLDKFEL